MAIRHEPVEQKNRFWQIVFMFSISGSLSYKLCSCKTHALARPQILFPFDFRDALDCPEKVKQGIFVLVINTPPHSGTDCCQTSWQYILFTKRSSNPSTTFSGLLTVKSNFPKQSFQTVYTYFQSAFRLPRDGGQRSQIEMPGISVEHSARELILLKIVSAVSRCILAISIHLTDKFRQRSKNDLDL